MVARAGQRRVMAALALDAETGLAHGYSVAATGQEALAEAFRLGTTRPPVPLPPGRPERILCSATIVGEVRRMLTDLLDHGGAPPVEEIVDALEAEDIFDSFLGHMAGRGQPTELASPEALRAGLAAAGAVGEEPQPRDGRKPRHQRQH
jgi:hypothetical protein